MKNKTVLFIFLLAAGYTGSAALHAQEKNQTKYANRTFHQAYVPQGEARFEGVSAKNVILMIGDGMGLTHLAAGMYANRNELSITGMPTVGLVKTQSADRFITDSGASGTAYATGSKTHNGAIGVDGDDRPLENIPQRLSGKGYCAGIVTTDQLSGATPSAFFAHQPDRGMQKEILAELPGSALCFVAGGSDAHFEQVFPDYKARLVKEKFTVTNDYRKAPRYDRAEKLAIVAYRQDVESIQNGRGNFLPETTRNAIGFLDGKKSKGFFLMVEGAQIDKRAHENNFGGMVQEVLDFDRAVAEALTFADKNGETLVLVTADHETGGLSIKGGDITDASMEAAFSSKGHTPVMVPIFAYGPSADRFKGVMENTEVMKRIMEVLGAGLPYPGNR